MKIMMILGIRPDIINMCMVIEQLEKRRINNVVVHTGQHYSYFFDKLFFEELKVKEPDYHLGIGSGTHGQQTARILEKSEEVMIKEKPDIVLAFSDANTALAAISATKLHIKVAHLEAGMRSHDWRMPEEKNRRMIDHISDYLFPPTSLAAENLIKEDIARDKIFVVGKIIVDVLRRFEKQIDQSDIVDKLDLSPQNYFLVTAHRPENVESLEPLRNLLKAFELVYKNYEKRIIYPIHPRTLASIRRMNLKVPKGVELLDPLGFFEFAKLEKNALCLITDSGTVQEEGCLFHVPCVTTRISTERPETVMVGSNIVAGLDPVEILKSVGEILNRKRDWGNPFGDGTASRKIVNILKQKEDEIVSPKVWW